MYYAAACKGILHCRGGRATPLHYCLKTINCAKYPTDFLLSTRLTVVVPELGMECVFEQQLHLRRMPVFHNRLHVQWQALQVYASPSQQLAGLLCDVPLGTRLCYMDVGNCAAGQSSFIILLAMAWRERPKCHPTYQCERGGVKVSAPMLFSHVIIEVYVTIDLTLDGLSSEYTGQCLEVGLSLLPCVLVCLLAGCHTIVPPTELQKQTL